MRDGAPIRKHSSSTARPTGLPPGAASGRDHMGSSLDLALLEAHSIHLLDRFIHVYIYLFGCVVF